MKKYNVDYYVSAKGFGHYLTRVLSLCVMYIGVGTGMRVNEFIEVRNNGLIEDDCSGIVNLAT
jgi:ribose 5-phosphate isomerase